MNKRLPEPLGDTPWHAPAANQGQMVCTSYGIDALGDCWARTDDYSTRTVSYRRLGHSTDPECQQWQPWNEVPACARI